MSRASEPVPTEITLHRKQRTIDIAFEDGKRFSLPLEYLRVFSPAAENKVARVQGDWLTNKQDVGIERIEPVGNYAVQLVFDDGHDTGIYSWDTLYRLGIDQESNLAEYRAVTEGGKPGENIDRPIRLLYFATLAGSLGREREEVPMSGAIRSVADLLGYLRKRDDEWDRLLAGSLTVTVNRQFANAETALKPGDEVALTPSSLE